MYLNGAYWTNLVSPLNLPSHNFLSSSALDRIAQVVTLEAVLLSDS